MDGEERICLTISQKRGVDLLCHNVMKRRPWIVGYDIGVGEMYIELTFKVNYGLYGNDSLSYVDRSGISSIMGMYYHFPPKIKKWLNILYESSK